jgi:predicted nucleic acid-binding protein
MAHYVELTWNDWRAVAELARELAGNGHKLPLTDIAVAIVAKRLDAFVYSTDPHFDVIPNLKRYIQ